VADVRLVEVGMALNTNVSTNEEARP